MKANSPAVAMAEIASNNLCGALVVRGPVDLKKNALPQVQLKKVKSNL
jgi:hypothetical protein